MRIIRAMVTQWALLSFLIMGVTYAADLAKVDREIATYAGVIGSNRLAKDPRDPNGLVLFRLSGKLRPTQDAFLLNAARLAKGLPIESTRTKVSENKLLRVIESRAQTLLKEAEEGNGDDDSLALLYFRVLEHFHPADNSVLLAIMKLKVKGLEGSLEDLLAGNIEVAEAELAGDTPAPAQRETQLDKAKADRFFEQACRAQSKGDDEAAQRIWQQFLQAEPEGDRAVTVRNGWVVLMQESFCPCSAKTWVFPVWSPDGKRIVFSGADGGVTATFGGQPTPLPGAEDVVRFLAWHPDGSLIAAAVRTPEGSWTFPYNVLPGGGVRRASEKPLAYGTGGAFHPDGTQFLASLAKSPDGGPSYCLAWHGLDGRIREVLPRTHPKEFYQEEQLSLGLDGRTVVSRAQRSTNPQDSPLFFHRLGEGEAAIRLTDGDACNQLPSIRADIQSALFHTVGKHGEISAVSLVAPAQCVKLLDGVVPVWSPDGRSFAYERSSHVMLARLGGLDTSPVAFATRQTGKKISIMILNRMLEARTVTVTYELFAPDAFRIDSGSVGNGKLRLPGEGTAKHALALRIPPGKRGSFTLKLTAVSADDRYTVKFVDVPIR